MVPVGDNRCTQTWQKVPHNYSLKLCSTNDSEEEKASSIQYVQMSKSMHLCFLFGSYITYLRR